MKKLLLLFGLFLLISQTFAQVTGTVYDENNNTLPGVNVSIKGTTKGVVTDINGNYSIQVQKGDVLVFQYVGYHTQEITITSLDKKYDVYLVPDVINMDEVVVMGYSNKTKTEVSSAVSVLNSDELMDVTSDDVGTMLQGKVAGVQVVTESGQPGSSSQIRIRGVSTIKPGNEEPLYVVDGIIGGTFDPNDIESITVLKDAGATGLYGARANKGVIIVTTKTGKAGKTQFNFGASVGMRVADQGNLKMMNSQQFYDWSKELYRDPQTHEIDIIKFYKFYPKELLNRDYDWVNNAFQPAMTQRYNLSVAGKNNKFTYYASGVYFNEKGTFMKTGYQKVNLRLNTEYRFNDHISLRNNFNVMAGKGSYYDYMDMYYTYLALPWDNPYNEDGTLKYIDGNTGEWWSRDKINPFHTIENSDHNSKSFDFNYDLVLNINIFKWLSFSSSNRFSYSTDKSHDYVSPVTAGPFHDKGYIHERQNNWYGAITSNMFNLHFDIEKHNITALAGFELNGGSSDYLWAEGKGLPEGFDVPSVASSEIKIGGTSTVEYFNSLISQVNYNYDKRYFVTASFRADQTSNFPPTNNWAYFPSIAASWMISNEKFISDNVSFMNLLKLRASYGVTGDPEIGASRFMGLFSLNSQYNNNPAAVPSQLPNYDLTWERTNEFNVGIDVGFVNRISFSVDVYNNVTKDLIVLAAQPLSQGFEYRWENQGTVTNKGIELNINALAVKSASFEWNIGLNFAKNSNTLSGIENPFYSTVGGVSQIYRNGASIYTFVLPKWLGVDTQTGAPLWEKVNPDGSKEPTSNYKDATPQEVGCALPDFMGGATTSVSWKSLTLYVSMAYQYGNMIYNSTRRMMDNDGHEPYVNEIVPKPDWSIWTKPGDVATHPSMQNAELSTENSSRYLEDGSFIKIRNISLSYDLPQRWAKSMGMDRVALSLRADNVFTWTSYWGQDPEVTLSKGDWSMPGVSDFKYPNNRQLVFNVSLNF